VSRPEFTAPSFEGCYRHPDRSTGIRCQRCGKPICGECMNPASVGFQCPSCIQRGQSTVRQPRTAFGAALTVRGGMVTKIIIGVLLGGFVLNLISRDLLASVIGLSNMAVLHGQYWRLLTYGFTTAGLLNTAMIALVLWFAGKPLEDQLGHWRFLVLYVLSGLGSATLFFVLTPPEGGSYGGASAAVIGLLAANGVIKYRRGEDIRPDIGLLVILVALNLVAGFRGLFWVAQIGGILVGALAGIVLMFAPRERRSMFQLIALLAVAGSCLVAVVLKTMYVFGMI
jgi:membrane associated rhomboid family serine protease